MSAELIKEVTFGAVFGLTAGYVSKKFGCRFIAGAATAGFLVLRGAIFEGHHLANWSPLEQDDSSFGSYLRRKARRETHSAGRRAEIFIKDNLVVIGGFTGGILLTS